MTTLQLKSSEPVEQAIADATEAACKVLDAQFPGWDAGGITSNFQGHLALVITQMLKGQSVLDGMLGHATLLPRLIVDDTFFGCPLIRGDMFLVHKPVKYIEGEANPVLVLNPDGNGFKDISRVGDAFTSFEAAAEHAMKYLVAEGYTLAEAKELKLQVVSVVLDPQSTSDTGFKIVAPLRAA